MSKKPAAARPSGAPAEPAGGLPKFAMAAIVLAAVALTFSMFREFSSIIAPAFLTVNLLVTAYPVHRWLTRQGVPRIVGALATGMTVILVMIVGLGAIVWSVTAMIGALRGYSAEFQALYQQAIDLLAQLGLDQAVLLDQLKSINPSSILNLVGNLASAGSSATGLLAVVVIVLVFLVMDLPTLGERFRLTRLSHPGVTDSIEAFVRGIRRYWLVTTVFGLIVAALDWVVLIALGIPLPLVWAVLSFVTNYIPNVGFIIGLVPPALLALVEKGPVTALIVIVAYSVLNFVIQSIIQPKYTGDAVGITPIMSFLSLLVWTAVFGALGALIALPFTLMVKALLIDSDPRTRWVNALIAADPKTSLPVKGAARGGRRK